MFIYFFVRTGQNQYIISFSFQCILLVAFDIDLQDKIENCLAREKWCISERDVYVSDVKLLDPKKNS